MRAGSNEAPQATSRASETTASPICRREACISHGSFSGGIGRVVERRHVAAGGSSCAHVGKFFGIVLGVRLRRLGQLERQLGQLALLGGDLGQRLARRRAARGIGLARSMRGSAVEVFLQDLEQLQLGQHLAGVRDCPPPPPPPDPLVVLLFAARLGFLFEARLSNWAKRGRAASWAVCVATPVSRCSSSSAARVICLAAPSSAK